MKGCQINYMNINSYKSKPPGGFIILYKILRVLVFQGAISPKEFQVYVWLSLQSFNDVAKTHFSRIAEDLKENPETIRKICNRLKAKKFIGFEMEQGRKSFTEFVILPIPYETSSYIKNNSEELEVKEEVDKEVPKEVTSLNKNSISNVTTMSTSIQQNSELPKKEVCNNININNIISRLQKALKISLREKDIQFINEDVCKFGAEVIHKSIDLAANKTIYSYSYFRSLIQEAENLVKTENYRKKREIESKKENEKWVKELAPPEFAKENITKLRKIFENGGPNAESGNLRQS